AAVEHRACIDRRLDPARAALEQRYAEGALEIGDYRRHGGLREAEPYCGPRHAALLADGQKNGQGAQPDSATDLMLAVEFLTHIVRLPSCPGTFNLRLSTCSACKTVKAWEASRHDRGGMQPIARRPFRAATTMVFPFRPSPRPASPPHTSSKSSRANSA